MPKAYFNADSSIPTPNQEYVLWIDIMGTNNFMSVSQKTSANFICKLHMQILSDKSENMSIYPVMDGAYITTKSGEEMKKFIEDVFLDLSEIFISEKDILHQFIVKGALSYGPVIHGKDITIAECYRDYMSSILLGMPMIQAHKGEKLAPPFGIYCDESVRMHDSSFSYRWFLWWKNGWKNDSSKKKKMTNALDDYYKYYKENAYKMDYEKSKIEEHEEKANEYFR
ncbi:MAG: hypothetical protein PUD90_01890 [Clostridia bacterium]|nr:hypothetical protein [Clostridia bacterium]